MSASVCATSLQKLALWGETRRFRRYPVDFVPDRKTKAAFIEPMLLLRTEKLLEGPEWMYELKLDGYRALAIRSSGKVHLRSRNDNDFNARYPGIVKALAANARRDGHGRRGRGTR